MFEFDFAIRVLLAGLFIWTGTAKLLTPGLATSAMRALRIPPAYIVAAVRAVGASEIVLGVTSLFGPGGVVAALVAGALAVFSTAALFLASRGVGCGCGLALLSPKAPTTGTLTVEAVLMIVLPRMGIAAVASSLWNAGPVEVGASTLVLIVMVLAVLVRAGKPATPRVSLSAADSRVAGVSTRGLQWRRIMLTALVGGATASATLAAAAVPASASTPEADAVFCKLLGIPIPFCRCADAPFTGVCPVGSCPSGQICIVKP